MRTRYTNRTESDSAEDSPPDFQDEFPIEFSKDFPRHRRGKHMSGQHRSRARRGAVTAAVLGVLKDGPRHGYGIMDELESKSEGRWRPSPGSVYPTLSRLRHKGLIEEVPDTDPREFALTDAGRTWLETNANHESMPFQDGPSFGLKNAVSKLAGAAKQVGRHGSDEQRERSVKLIEEAARQMYAMLAEAPATPDEPVTDTPTAT